VKGKLPAIVLVVLVFLGGLGMLGGGTYLVVVQLTGEEAQARITDCHRSGGRYRSDVCNGTWVAGGSLLEGGRVVLGTVEGADSDDIGKTLDVRLSGDRAYTRSWRVAVILIGFGLALTIVGIRLVWMMRTASRRQAPPAHA
jgi:hypothetical protein